MRPDQASRTAEWVCLLRALEQTRAPGQRLLDDTLAQWFLTRPSRRLLTLARRTGRWGRGILPRLGQELAAFVPARHRWMDDRLLAFLAAHPNPRVLLLGAGYDTRPWRLPLVHVPVVEVDHPATASRKRHLMDKHKEHFPARPLRTCLTVDFQRQGLGERLDEIGFSPDPPTFVVWEGVSMYLSEAAFCSTLSLLSARTPVGSELVLDAWWPDAPGAPALERRAPKALSAVGEPMTLPLPPDHLEALVEPLGWELIAFEAAADLVRQLQPGARRVLHTVYVAALRRVDADQPS